MNNQIIFNILIIVWLFTIEKRLGKIDTAFGTIGLVLDRLYRKVFGKDNEDEKTD